MAEDIKIIKKLEKTIGVKLKKYPDLDKLRRSYPISGYCLDEDGNATGLGLYRLELDHVPPEVFALKSLQSLYLYKNQLTSLPEAIVSLKSLQSLDLSNNQLTSLPEAIGALKSLQSLYLGSNKLTSLPEAICDLKSLQSLDLYNNKLMSLPRVICELKSLQTLDLGRNGLTSLLEAIGALKTLQTLYLRDNELTSLPEAICDLKSLQSLDLESNALTSLPEAIVALKSLQTLNLYNNALTSLPEAIVALKSLQSLYLRDNQLTSLPEAIVSLKSLQSLDLGNNQLTSLPEAIVSLKSLQSLYLGDNQLTSLPEAIVSLKSLQSLDLGSNQLTSLPEAIVSLKSLQLLDLRYNKLTSLNPSLLDLDMEIKWELDEPYEGIFLEDNPLESPPIEIVKKGKDAVKRFFDQIEAEGKDYIYEAKLLVVGEGGAGKTSLAKKIEDPDYELDSEEKSTEGIDIIKYHFPIDNGRTFTVNIWDFGGQEIYHATHQFFLTKRSLYALVADTRNEDTDFYYWLKVVELLSDKSPLLIIKNEKQDRHRVINENQLRANFLNIKDVLATNLKTNRDLDKVVKEIEFQIGKLTIVGSPLPMTWVKVRAKLEEDTRNYISLDEYYDICQQNGFITEKDKLQLSDYLHDLGVCLHFQDDPLLRKLVILKPEWGTDAVYKVIDNGKVIKNHGEFKRSELADIWCDKKYENKRDELLQLMIKFKLCYRIPELKNTYVAPQLLTDNQPKYEWDDENNLYMKFKYDSFMPKGILTRFIVDMHPYIDIVKKNRLVWKTGVVLSKNNTRAEVIEHYGEREIKIRICGKNKRELLTVVNWVLDSIHEINESYHGLKYSKLIPCNCERCKESLDPYFFEYETLLDFAADKDDSIQCLKSRKMVSVLGLIDDVIGRDRFIQDEKKRGMKGKGYGDLEERNEKPRKKIFIEKQEMDYPVRSAWGSGSYYISTYGIVIAITLFILNFLIWKNLPLYFLPGIMVLAALITLIICSLQLRHDDKLSQKYFMKLVNKLIDKLFDIKKLFRK